MAPTDARSEAERLASLAIQRQGDNRSEFFPTQAWSADADLELAFVVFQPNGRLVDFEDQRPGAFKGYFFC